MKSVITTICVLIPLVIIFVIIDRKDFHSGNDVAVQQETVTRMKSTTVTTVKPVEKPAETKPVETKNPVESKPVTEAKPAETKPVTEAKPAEPRPAETKPATETKPVAEKKPVETKQADAKPTETKPVAEKKPVETKQTEAKSTETKPVAEAKKPAETKPVTETKPAEKKPVEAKPVVETRPATAKPAETKPMTEKKPVAETKPATTKPAETKPATTTKPMPAPEAVSVVTAEEAAKLNEFALFLVNVKTTVVEGEIVERSELPDPQKSDYPNCRFTVHFNGNSIKSGEPCPKELSLIVEGFEDYRILPNNDIKTGDKVQCTIFPFEKLPEDYQSTQQADDLELFLLESYYVLDISAIKKFTDNELMPMSGIYFSEGNEEYVSLFDRHLNDPVPTEIKNAQNADIQYDAKRMDGFLTAYTDAQFKEINARFAEAWNEEKKKDPPGYNRVGAYVWRNLNGSFWTLPAGTSSILSTPDKMSQEMLDCFLHLKQALEANGVQLIVSLVPTMNVIAARVINKEFKDVPDIQTATYVKQLSEIGVEAIYASDQIINNYNRYPFAFFVPENPHPSDTAQDVVSDLLVDRLKRYEIASELDGSLFSESIVFRPVKEKEVFPPDCDIGDNKVLSPYMSREILYNGEKIQKNKDSSQIMVVGNSFIETPISPPDSLPVLLSYKLRAPIDWYRISGYGPFSDILIQLLSNPDFYLKNKKVLVFYVGTMHMTAVSRSETMLDIAKLDNERVILNNKKMKGHVFLQSNVESDQIADTELWGALTSVEKTVLKVDKTESMTFSFKTEQFGSNISESEPFVCIIPHMCTRNTSCTSVINGISKPMHCPNYTQNARFFNLAFELPAGTKELTIKFEGKAEQVFAIKDIQLWQ